MNTSIYTCAGADDGMMALDREHNGAYTCRATVDGVPVKMRYMGYEKRRVLALFRAYLASIKK